ncbi:MAG TPA: PatB family C-S lyase [Candidatus Binatia bacterium]
MDMDDLDIAALRRLGGVKWADCDDGAIAAWVADMDFPVAEPIARALSQMLERSDLGYPVAPRPGALPSIFAARMRERFGWDFDPERVEVVTDVVQALHLAVDTFSEAGDSIITPLPIYPPFLEAVEGQGRVAVWQRYVASGDGYRIDVPRLRSELQPATRMLLVCNPHNPTGRVLTTSELAALAQIALERDLVVVSDEIHSDLVYPGRAHVPMASLGSEIAARTITLSSASKAFNIAGLRCAVAVFGTPELQQSFNRIHRHARGGLGSFGLAATAAAWTEGQPWLDEVLAYLQGNRDLVADHAGSCWPGVVHFAPEATYLAWLDFGALALGRSPQRYFLDSARVLLSPGEDFGEAGRGCVRLNFATSRPILREILARLDGAIEKAGQVR